MAPSVAMAAPARVDPMPELQYRDVAGVPSADERAAWGAIVVVYDTDAVDAVASRWPAKLRGLMDAGDGGVVARLPAPRALTAEWDALAARVPAGAATVVGVGGGTCVDAAKWVATRRGLRLVHIPTALTVDAFFTNYSGYRLDGCVRYDRTKACDLVVVDLEVLAAAPQRMRAAALCDVLSIQTGLADWRLARDAGRLDPEHPYDEMAARLAEAIFDAACGCAAAAGRGDHAGLRRLVEVLCLEVALCNQIGHSRPEEGSEHYLCYLMESLVPQERFTHAELVGPGLLVAAELQRPGSSRALRDAYAAAGLSWGRVPAPAVAAALRGVREYSERHRLPYGVAHTVTEQRAAAVDLAALLAGGGSARL